MDKEHEIPEFLRSAITSVEHEKQAREIFEKAYGLEYVKPKYLETREELNKLKPLYEQQTKFVNDLSGLLQQGKFGEFAKQLKIPDEMVYQYALDRLQYDQLPPEQKAQMEKQQQTEMRLAQAEQYIQQMQQAQMQSRVQEGHRLLDGFLSQGEVKQVADDFNARMAQKGIQKSFRDLVIEQGYLMSQRQGKDVDPSEALQAAMAIAAFEQPQKAAPVQTPPMSPQVIPHVTGRGGSVTKKAPKSIDDLKNRYKELQ